jgi:hypothetical protein
MENSYTRWLDLQEEEARKKEKESKQEVKIKVTEEMKQQASIEANKRDAHIKHHFEVNHLTKEQRDQLGFCGEFATCSLFDINWKDNIRDNYYTIDDCDVIIGGNKCDVKTETVPWDYANKIINRTIKDDELYGRRLIHENQYGFLNKYDLVIFGLFIRHELNYFYLIGYLDTATILATYTPTIDRPDGGKYPFAACPIPTSALKPIQQLLKLLDDEI